MKNQPEDIDYKSLLTNAYLKLKDLRDQRDAIEMEKSEPIAIVGMSCRFPGAKNVAEYWDLLKNGIDAITEIPSSRWDINKYYDENPDTPGKMYTRYGGFIEDADKFDGKFFGIAPKEANHIDPQQRLLLEVSWEALESACIVPSTIKDSPTGIFVGLSTDDYEHLSVNSLDTSTINAYSSLGTARSIAAGRLAYVLGLQGPVMQLDTACSSSLVSIHLACQSLRNKECNLALAGGVNLMLSPSTTIAFSKLKALAKDGRCKTFNANADGYARGEGCGVLVLKRLSDAIASKDRIFALVKGSSVNHDGESNGLTAPNGSAQETLLKKVLKNTNIRPSQVQYIETHGTGTSLGDPIEVLALGRVYGQERTEPVYIGSVKSNIGHLEAGAGVASIIKVVLSIMNAQIPQSLHFNEPNPLIPWKDLKVKVASQLTPWPSVEGKKLAGVSAFGMSGTNVHLLIEESPIDMETQKISALPHHLLALSSESENGIEVLRNKYIDLLSREPDKGQGDICYSSLTGRSHFSYREALVVKSPEDALKQLSLLKAGNEKVSKLLISNSKIGFLFTGQGSQYVNMGKELYENQPLFRRIILECSEILEPYLGISLTDIIYNNDEESSLINDTFYTQPSLFAIEYALASLWRSWGIEPEIVMGHSVGEYAAACISGVFSLEDGLKLIAARGKLMGGLPRQGSMLNVFTSKENLSQFINPFKNSASIAAINGPEHVVLSGDNAAMEELMVILKENNIRHKKLNVSHAFHSPLMTPILDEFERIAKSVKYNAPQINIISNTTGQLIHEEIASPSYWVDHITETVQFEKSLQSMEKSGCNVFVEMGPNPHMIAMAKSCVQEDNKLWLPSLKQNHSDFSVLLNSLRELHCKGFDIDWKGYYKDYDLKKTDIPTYPFEKKRLWIESNVFERVPLTGLKVSASKSLLGDRVKLPFSKEIRFEAQYDINTPAFLADHKLFGEVIAPAAQHVSMVLSSFKKITGKDSCVLEDVFFTEAMLFSESDGPKAVQLILDQEHDNTFSFQIVSRRVNDPNITDQSWSLHSLGKIKSLSLLEEEIPDPEEIKVRLKSQQSGSEFYELFNRFGYHLGSSFKWINNLWKGEGESLGKLIIPSLPDDISDYQLYPGLIDSFFQVMAGCINGEEINSSDEPFIFIPYNLGSFKLYKLPANNTLWCYSKINTGSNSSPEKLKGNIWMYDDSGTLIATATNFESRKAYKKDLLQKLKKDINQLIYEVQWFPVGIKEAEVPSVSSVLILGNDDTFSQNLSAYLTKRGLKVIMAHKGSSFQAIEEDGYIINPTDKGDFLKLFDSISTNLNSSSRLIYLWGMNTSSISNIEEGQKETLDPVLNIIHSLNNLQGQIDTKLWFITRGINDLIDPALIFQSTLHGLAKVIAFEHPEVFGGVIDLSSLQSDQESGYLFNEVFGNGRETCLYYKNGYRHVQRLVSKEDKPPRNFILRQDSSYIITGGTGALGLLVAKWLAEKGAKKLILVTRSGATKSAQKKALESIEAMGVLVSIVQADVSEEDEVLTLVNKIKENKDTLSGVIHAAGILDDGFLFQQNWDRFKKVLKPKVMGGWNLHKHTKDLPLDFFITFSSVASIIGSAGQANYVAANAFLDSLAFLRKKEGLPILNINWGPWSESGMAASSSHSVKTKMESLGIQGIASEVGIEALDKLVHESITQAVVIDADWTKIMKAFPSAPLFSKVIEKQNEDCATEESSAFLNELKSAPLSAQRPLLANHITEQVRAILGLDSNDVLDPTSGLFDLGMDSLMATEFRNSLQKSLNISLSPTIVFKYPSVSGISEHIAEQVLGKISADIEKDRVDEEEISDMEVAEIEQLSEEELEKLISEEFENLKK